ncbi:MAG: hypothetical protein IPH06_08730 [Alphaproteobacteria bacterium]|jgi:hypothetical protein|nr:hypothetical protein [Alphaproteobacteria bacterium]QQS58085.1 MAG: hypothetical protein IPN28_04490 [Alphaproteobacteria bacterium]
MTNNQTPDVKTPKIVNQRLRLYVLEAILGFFFAILMGIAYFGSGFELEFIYQGF